MTNPSLAVSGLTDHLVDLACSSSTLPEGAVRMARYSLFDWMTCGLAGINEPVARHLRQLAADEGAAPVASVIGGGKTSVRTAALVNGTISHALDYDDTHFAHIGHLSVGIYPAALATGEQRNRSVADMVTAFLLGAEGAIRVGLALGSAHYDRGFHQTATAGAFGAVIAAGRLLGLTPAQMREAIGLAATRASGIKNQFGSMGKPLNAGLAAANGVEVSLWAALGLTSARDGLEGANGFLATHSDLPDPAAGIRDGFLFGDVKYKLHACCHGTHAMIEALLAVPKLPAADEIAAIHLRTNPRWLTVCDIKRPRSGLEVKFSYAWLAAMVVTGVSTAAEDSYSEPTAADPELGKIASFVTVVGDSTLTEMQAMGEIVLADGRVLPFKFDLDSPCNFTTLDRGLRDKSATLLGRAKADALWQAALDATGIKAVDLGNLLRETCL